MPETFFYPDGKRWFPRSYVSGFVGSTGIINMHMVGNVLVFDYLSSFIHCEWVMDLRVYPATSNVYSHDIVLDGPASSTYVGGVLTPGNSAISFYPMTTRSEWRIQVLATLAADESQRANWPIMSSNYWRPLGGMFGN